MAGFYDQNPFGITKKSKTIYKCNLKSSRELSFWTKYN